MKKISLLMMTLIVAATMSATVVKFDFSDPKALGLTPSSKTGEGVSVASETITVDAVAMTFTVPSGNGAKIWTAKGPTYTLRLYQPSSMTLTSSGDNIRGIRVSRTQGDITELDENSEWRGNAKSVTLSVPTNGKANYITMIQVYVGEEMPTTTVDTISVSEARQRIDAKNMVPCYIKAVVAGAPYVASSRNCVWLTDINTPGDSIQGFGMRKGKASTETYKTLVEMAGDFGLQDTILVYADALGKYNSIYEIAGGYFVETIGKSAAIDASEQFPYSYGAIQMEMVEGKYRYEIVLSKEDEAYENALHYIIRTDKEKGIVGTYSTFGDSSYVDGYGRISGSLTIAFVSEGNPENTYALNGNFTLAGTLYRFDNAQYSLAGYPDAESDEPFQLKDDVPFIPEEGDTITCAQAASYASTLTPDTESELTVFVRGFATGTAKVTGRSQQSVYMNDDASAKTGTFEGYLCYTQNLDSIIKGDEVIVKGKIQYSSKGAIAEISKGKIYRIGGSSTKRPRNPQLEARPADAITVEQALAIGNALVAEVGQTVETSVEYTVAGFIVDVNRQADKDSATWYMADVKGDYGEFEAYKCQIKSLICEDDEVYVIGKIAKFQKSAEVANIEIAKGRAGFISLASSLKEVVAAVKDIKSKKMLVDGQLYIVQDGVLYNAQGNVIR